MNPSASYGFVHFQYWTVRPKYPSIFNLLTPMPRLKKAQKARKEAAKKAHTTRRANSRRWLLESFAPRSHHSTPGWDQTDRASPCVTKDNQHTLAPQPNSPESGTALAPAKQPTSQPPKTRGPCRQTIWRRKKREEARQASTCAKAEKTAAQKKSPDPTVQPESRAETRSVLESFAPHSCIDPVTYRQHKTYNPENTAPGSPQGDQDSSQSSQPTVSPGHSQRVSPNAGTERHTQELGSPPAAVHGPCRQTIWRRKKREKARNEPDTQTESESGVSPDNREGQNMDIGERKFTQAVQKWPRGSVVRDVDLKNKVLDAGEHQHMECQVGIVDIHQHLD